MEAVYFCFSVYFVKITPFATNASTLVNMTEIVNPSSIILKIGSRYFKSWQVGGGVLSYFFLKIEKKNCCGFIHLCVKLYPLTRGIH